MASFDDEMFSEDELASIRRMLPGNVSREARALTRGEFFKRSYAPNCSRAISSLRQTFFAKYMGLSKRKSAEAARIELNLPISKREV